MRGKRQDKTINKCSYIKTLLLFLFIPVALVAQSERQIIYQCFISGDMKKWKTTIDNMSKMKLSDNRKIELINYYYGYIGYQLGVDNKNEAEKYVSKGEGLIDNLLKTETNNADLYAYKGAYIGFRIGISPIKAPFIGKSSMKNVKTALEMNPNSIQANIEQANVLYFAPSMFGGDKTESKKYYNKAISLFEANDALRKGNWLYLSLLTALAKIYTLEKDYKSAKLIYEKVLSLEPNFAYVKNELYQDILKKMK